MSQQKQIFGSALKQPWALVKWGGDQPNGRRPSTAVAYLTDPIKNDAGEIVGYEGGLVEYCRYRITTAAGRYEWESMQWHFRYRRPREFSVSDICEFFPNSKSREDGPVQAQIRAAKRRVPVNEEVPS